ncbi:MAG: hypothetical protein Q8P85_03195 [Pseudomonas sp.]|nr:hypothetical protein [Pseudomonas sp.]
MIMGITEIQIAALTGRAKLLGPLPNLLDLQTARRVTQIADIGLQIDGRPAAIDPQHLRLGSHHGADQHQHASPQTQAGEKTSNRELIRQNHPPIATDI